MHVRIERIKKYEMESDARETPWAFMNSQLTAQFSQFQFIQLNIVQIDWTKLEHTWLETWTADQHLIFLPVRLDKKKNLEKMLMIYVITTYILHVIAVGNGYEYGKKLPCEAFLTLNMFGLQQCFIECKAYRLCLSINYNRTHLVCGLNSVKRNSTLLPINDDDFVYNEITNPVRLLIVVEYIKSLFWFIKFLSESNKCKSNLKIVQMYMCLLKTIWKSPHWR